MTEMRNSNAGLGDKSARCQIVGIGKATKGLAQFLGEGDVVVLGRSPDCTIQCRPSGPPGEVAHVSRQHAVVEQRTDGRWTVHDAGSSNGTILLRGGLPPSLVLTPGAKVVLEFDDVVELGGSSECQFVFQSAGQSEPQASSDAALSKTLPLDEVEGACVYRLSGGGASKLVDREMLSAGAIAVSETGQAIPARSAATTAGDIAVTFSTSPTSIVAQTHALPVALNGEPAAPHGHIVLRDKDLLTLGGHSPVRLLSINGNGLKLRNLSDLLGAGDRIVIGSSSESSCRVVDPTISRRHAEVWRNGDELLVRDLASSNGTRVNGCRVSDTTRLAVGSVLSIGRVEYSVDQACWLPSPSRSTGIDVRFVGVSVEIAGQRRLHSVSMGVGQGELIGLIGPSASGKSTLLKTLAGEHRASSGRIYVNGAPLESGNDRWDWYSSLLGYRDETYEIGFVQQIDLVQPGLTVREILVYAGRHMGLSSADSRTRAERAANLCNLEGVLDRVALTGDGRLSLSGGQLKRVCVALEILRQPRILLLDEPTTGQDPSNTDSLMDLFRSIAQGGVTLLMSTHDLRSIILFDKVAALCLGRLVYFGPPSGFAEYFGKATAGEVYRSLPDREGREAEAIALDERFRKTRLFREHCHAEE